MSMWWDLSLQALMIIVSIGMYFWLNDDIPRKLITKYYDYRNRDKHKSRRHFVKAAELLSKSRSFLATSSKSISFAAEAAAEADSAVRLDPTDAANHIVCALALDRQGFKPSALEAINAAFAPVAVKSLTGEEKADALVRRGELRVEVSRIGGVEVDESVWSTVEREMREAVELKEETEQAWCLLGECCEGLGKLKDARDAFNEALQLDPNSLRAKQGAERLIISESGQVESNRL